jgi:hypothetical protein
MPIWPGSTHPSSATQRARRGGREPGTDLGHAVLLCLASALLASAGCSVLLDFESNQHAVAAITDVRAYRFLRGHDTLAVDPSAGLLGPGSARVRAGSIPTDRGGSIALRADGGFAYEPPGPSGSFWGDDAFELALQENAPGDLTRVRLTVHPERLQLGELNSAAKTGFNVLGPSDAWLGQSSRHLTALGDVNGDGFDDWAAAAPGRANPLPSVDNLSAYVVFGGRDPADLVLSTLDAGDSPHGFRIKAERAADFFAGGAISGAGDVNGDGLDDVIVGAFGVEDASGAAYVIFGKADTAPVSVADLEQGVGGFAIIGDEPTSFQGVSVSSVGDANGDGLDDVILGGFAENAGDVPVAGVAFVVWGKVGTEPVQLGDIKSGQGAGFAVFGAQTASYLGIDVRAAGDVNGDGLDDVVVGAFLASPGSREQAGSSYVVFGKTGTEPVPVAELAAPSALGFEIGGAEAMDRSGLTVSGAGDVNGDGFDDVVVSSPCADLGLGGPPRAPEECAANLTPEVGPLPGVVPPTGLTYVVFGQRAPVPVQLADIERGGNAAGFVIVGARPDDQLGASLSAGDLDGDGLGDLLIGASNRTLEGHAYVVFGKADAAPVALAEVEATSAADAAGEQRGGGGLALFGAGRDVAGVASTTGADINGDGLDDLFLGALFHQLASQQSGGVYVAFGWDMSGALENRYGVVRGTPFEDRLLLPRLPVVKVRGGNGRDTLVIDGHERHVDLAGERARFESIEVIDLRGDGANTLRLDDAAVRRIPKNHAGFAFGLAHTLTVLGEADDRLEFDLTGYEIVSGTEGRVVYARSGAYYGLEVSQALPIVPPDASP